MRSLKVALAALSLVGGVVVPAYAQKYRVVAVDESFYDGVYSVLNADTQSNLYGEIEFGEQTPHAGSVFLLKANDGYAQIRSLYQFGSGDVDVVGGTPSGGVTVLSSGILGTATYAGVGQDGTVFDLGHPDAVSATALHAFSGMPSDGKSPQSGLVSGPNKLLYGDTQYGGVKNQGTIFEISASTTSSFYRVIHDFGAAGDLTQPIGTKLVVDGQGRLFGMTLSGGATGNGGIFMLQKADGVWTYTVLYSFGTAPDVTPVALSNLAIDGAGNLYGCGAGGAASGGGVFRLVPPQTEGGAWQESIIHTFNEQPDDGYLDADGCGVAIDPATDFIVGTVPEGGRHGYGVLFSLQPSPDGNHWVERIEHAFFGAKIDGGHPVAPPFELSGTYYGGNTMNGSIYAFTP